MLISRETFLAEGQQEVDYVKQEVRRCQAGFKKKPASQPAAVTLATGRKAEKSWQTTSSRCTVT